MGLSLQHSPEELAADLCLSRVQRKVGHCFDPHGNPFCAYIMISLAHSLSTKRHRRLSERVYCTARKKNTWGFEVLWPVSKQQGSREGNRERLFRLRYLQVRDISPHLFCVLFSKIGSAGELHLCNIRWLYNPACTRGNSHPEHPWLESCTHFSAKFLEAMKLRWES